MTQQIINLGTADKGNGDVLRTAFTKVNDNFAELYNSVSAVVVVGATAPAAPGAGDLWWNSESGRMYVYFGTAWVDASPVDGAGISSTNELVNGSKTVSLGTDGYITLAHGAKLYDYGSGTGNGYGITDAVNGTYIGYDPADTLGALHMDSYNGKNIRIRTTTLPSTYKDWLFGANGSLTFPDTTAQTTAWTGSVSSLVNGVNSVSLDNGGLDLTFTSGEKIKTVFGGGIELYRSGDNTIGIYTGGAEIKTFATGGAKHIWTFGTDGNLTLPSGNSVISNLVVVGDLSTGSQIQVGSGVEADTGIIISNSVTNSLGEGGPALESGSLVNVNGSSAYMALKTVNSLGGDSTLTGEEMVEVSSSGVRIGVRVTNDLGDGSPPLVAFQGWTFGTDGSLTLPGAVVKSTVAKTGATIPTTTGPINNFNFSPLDGSGGLVDGTNIGPLTVGTMIFFAGVENGLPFGSYIQTQPILTIGDTIGTIDSGDLGGTPGTTFTLTVTNVVQETPTAIDLTKSVNKLTNGEYTLANGVEGQIMYLVRQTGSTAHNVTVANVRLNGTVYTDVSFTPFTDGTDPTNMATLIFTDGAWQSMGGFWNLT